MKKLHIILLVLIGNCILAFAVACFTLPANIVVGGTTGLALIGRQLFGLDISITVMIANVVLFILGYLVLGKTFALTTIVSTFIYPFMLEFFQNVSYLQNLSDDILLSTLFSGALSGIGIGLVIKAGASTGGMDIPPLILNKKLGWNVSWTMNILDTLVILSLAFVYLPIQLLYGILSTVIMTYAINKILMLGEDNMQLMIISKDYEKIRDAFIHELDYGISLIHMETGYTKQESKAVMCVCTPRQLSHAKRVIHDIDPHAFVTMSTISEVSGKGFTLAREYIHHDVG